MSQRTAFLLLCVIGTLCCTAACTRTKYRLRADDEAYGILAEKARNVPGRLPLGFQVYPDPRSRFFDPTPLDDPRLPIPAPRLYAYNLPDAARNPREEVSPGRSESAAASDATPLASSRRSVATVAYQVADEQLMAGQVESPFDIGLSDTSGPSTRIPPLPVTYWEAVPERCLRRMYEFVSVRAEHARSFGTEPGPEARDGAERLSLEEILAMALINSREYQTQKEALYRAALQLTLPRFEYVLRFSPTGNGTGVDFLHRRSRSKSSDPLGTPYATDWQSRLSVPSTLQAEKVLATGANIVASFANDVVLTFNDSEGVVTELGSSLVFDFSQRLLQRDIQFEALTQAERNVVYAARDYARYRKIFFRDVTTAYYNLLLSYRAIEIAAQDYFTTTRAFNQGEAEYRASRLPRFQVDQLEQNALSSGSRLIAVCNALEDELDQFKLLLGLPTEMPINLDLDELEKITLRDEVAVMSARVRRAQRSLRQERQAEPPDHRVVLNSAADLVNRQLDLLRLRRQLGESGGDVESLLRTRDELAVVDAFLLIRLNRLALEQARASDPPAPPFRTFQRTVDVVDSLRVLVERILFIERGRTANREERGRLEGELTKLRSALETIRGDLDQAVAGKEVQRIPEFVQSALLLLAQAEGVADDVLRYASIRPLTLAQEQEIAFRAADRLLDASDRLLVDAGEGLVPIEVTADDAMLTALTQRLELMNLRGQLADDWRRIKLAGDELRSVLDLSASQVLTADDRNSDFFTTVGHSNTQLALRFDAPLNRKAQRNLFRDSLIDYQRARRDLMAFEDTVKLRVRSNLRQLEVDREQYRIAVASAALAFERVVSTRLQLLLGIQNVAARDFLEAQQAYTGSLNTVASGHIRYLLNRIDLFLELELLEVDDANFWRELYDESFQPQPRFAAPPGAGPSYGELPPGVWYSRRVRRMLNVPEGIPSLGTGVQAELEEVLTPPADRAHDPAALLPTPTPLD